MSGTSTDTETTSVPILAITIGGDIGTRMVTTIGGDTSIRITNQWAAIETALLENRAAHFHILCDLPRNVEVGHLDGHEENGEPENLLWNCRACNIRLGVAFKRLGIGPRIRQLNPSEAAKSLGQWVTVVTSLMGPGL
jgi:hypothetical protein